MSKGWNRKPKKIVKVGKKKHFFWGFMNIGSMYHIEKFVFSSTSSYFSFWNIYDIHGVMLIHSRQNMKRPRNSFISYTIFFLSHLFFPFACKRHGKNEKVSVRRRFFGGYRAHLLVFRVLEDRWEVVIEFWWIFSTYGI